ncbi:MAG: ABC transporter ATP-binding protein [Gemmatimonadota bacterium]|nr:MAG: ABC transporter ATP-binding protein [Gemmatimonadota bacterium]
MAATALLRIEDLDTTFYTEDETIRAVRGLTLEIHEGQTLGLVGESGSGKSVTSLSILRLLPDRVASIERGRVSFLGRDLLSIPQKEMFAVRGAQISMIFQEPMTSLNPVLTVGHQVAEAILIHQSVDKKAARERTIELFREVGLPEPERRVDMYPHELSGGQQQRVMIAMALSCNPKLLIADEPTTALDVTIQAQILDLLRNLRDTRKMSILFISHDLGVIAEIADEVAVMYRGELVEHGSVLDIFENPKHPYTRGLLACRPRLETQFTRLPSVGDFMGERTLPDGTLELYDRNPDLTEFQTPRPERAAAVGAPLLTVRDLKVHFPIRKGLLQRVVGQVKAVDGISFSIHRGRTLGLVGESGCGKTTTGRAILRLVEPTAGQVHYDGQDLCELRGLELRRMRKRMQIIFQDPYGSLNPRLTVETALVEPMDIHGIGSSRKDRRDRAAALLDEVGLGGEHLKRYPHEFSGGQRQRVCIARALTVDPEFIICDESVSALDVSVQAQVLNLLRDLQEKRSLTYVFISHDLAVVKYMSDELAVMHDGRFVEEGLAHEIYANPREDYTRRLIEAIPNDQLDILRERQRARGNLA